MAKRQTQRQELTENQKRSYRAGQATNIFIRLFYYFTIWIPTQAFAFIWLFIYINRSDSPSEFINGLILLSPFFLIGFFEYLHHKKIAELKKQGIVTKEQIKEYFLTGQDDEVVRAEMRLEKEKLEKATQDANKKDLNYWFELKEKGAITEEEYQKKKEELI
jgi:hypothetical protein